MSRMILSCDACGAQNFVAAERRAVASVPPRCWKCGEVLAMPRETVPDGRESNRRTGGGTPPGEERNA
ncbi:MAG: hypothetical protein ACM3NF_00055 [Gemmatimonadota bacterium]